MCTTALTEFAVYAERVHLQTALITTRVSTTRASTPRRLLCIAGWNGNQVVGGLLLQTTRKTVTKSCGDRFSKFLTACTETAVIYDADTGEVVVQPTTTGGLLPYGVDAVFLESSSEYDASLSVGQRLIQYCCSFIHSFFTHVCFP